MIKRCLYAIFLGMLILSARAESLSTVTIVIPERFIAVTTGETAKIFIDGPISQETVSQLAAEVKKKKISAGMVYLNSPGGSLLAGIELGKAIRRGGFDTNVGRRQNVGALAKDGGCYSACVFAYIGGGYRYASGNSQIGVHRFSTSAPATTDLDMAQILSAAITSHLNAMGVDVALFERMVQAPSDGIIVLTKAEQKNMRVVNNGVLPTTWALVNTQGIIYLKGEQQTDLGLGKFIFNCVDGVVYGAAFYEGGSNADTIAATQRYSLRINSQFLPIVLHRPVQLKNGYVSAYFPLSKNQLRDIVSAQEVGFAFHPPNPDLFFGFTVSLVDGRSKIVDFAKFCTTQKR